MKNNEAIACLREIKIAFSEMDSICKEKNFSNYKDQNNLCF